MKKVLRALNLQLFAESEDPSSEERPFEVVDDRVDAGPRITTLEDGNFEIADDDDTFETEGDDHEEGQETADDDELQQQEEVEDEQPKGKKNETANAVIAERRKWQERMKKLEDQAKIAQRLMKNAGVDNIDALQAQLDAYEAQSYQEQGMDPQTANALVKQRRELDQMKRDIQSQKFDVEVSKLKDDPFFADIEDWRDELEPIALSTGQSLESVYMAQRGRERMKEYQREMEHRAQASRQKKSAAKVNTTGGAGAVKKTEKVNLSPDQLGMAKIAVKNGTFKSVEEYAKYAKK